MVFCLRFSQICLVLLVPKCRNHKDVGKLLLILPGKSQMSNFETPCLTAISKREQKSMNPRRHRLPFPIYTGILFNISIKLYYYIYKHILKNKI